MMRWLPKRLARLVLAGLMLTGLVVAAATSGAAPASALGLDPAFPEGLIGPKEAKGVVVWSHGRSINAEDSDAPNPAYLRALRDDGWEVMRFDRASQGDTLKDSSRRLVDYAIELKRKGYHQVALAGQSFGAFLALMAADASPEVDAVIATAPAAFGNFDDFYDSWQSNATRLYPLLEQVKRARVMLFYFHGDDFDPGGRGEASRQILSRRGLNFAVVDQPAFLTGHWASSSGLFLRRFGNCIRDFIDSTTSGEQFCSPHWGTVPSAELKLPPELADPRQQSIAVSIAAAPTGSSPTGSAAASDAAAAPHSLRDVWYGFYPNGREVLFGIEVGARRRSDGGLCNRPEHRQQEPGDLDTAQGTDRQRHFRVRRTRQKHVAIPPAAGWRARRDLDVDRPQDLDDCASEIDRPAFTGRASGARQGVSPRTLGSSTVSSSTGRCCPRRR